MQRLGKEFLPVCFTSVLFVGDLPSLSSPSSSFLPLPVQKDCRNSHHIPPPQSSLTHLNESERTRQTKGIYSHDLFFLFFFSQLKASLVWKLSPLHSQSVAFLDTPLIRTPHSARSRTGSVLYSFFFFFFSFLL